MVHMNGMHAHFIGHFIQIGMGEMGGVIVVHAAFAAPLDVVTFNGALARIFILISNDHAFQLLLQGEEAGGRWYNGVPMGADI